MKSKWTKRLVSLLAVITCGASCLFTACGGEPISRDEKEINVRVALAGYGSDYIYVLKDKFEEAYKSEGYKVNILRPSTDIVGDTVLQELYSANDWSDLYFTSSMVISRYADGEYGQVVADLTDIVWNQKAIGFDGKDEAQTVEEKFNMSVPDDQAKYNGRRYSFYSSNSVGGMIVNLAKLEKYGCSIPKTTNQLFDAFDKIYNGTTVNGTAIGKSEETGIYPMTYLSSLNGYPLHMVHAFFAQYVGADAYDDFWGFVDSEGNRLVENGYELFNPESETGKGLNEMLKVVYKAYDPKYSAPGSAQSTISSAHNLIMTQNRGAVFMCDGEWAYNECLADYKNNINDLGFMNIPVISALGTKLFGSGTSYNKSDAECEEILAWIIERVDEKKEAPEIVTLAQSQKSWTLATEDVEAVCVARGVYCGRSIGGGNVLVAEKSDKKDIAALFLRMFASDDYAKEFVKATNSFTAFDKECDAGTKVYANSYKNLLSNHYAKALGERGTALRSAMGQSALLPSSGVFVVNNIIIQNVTGEDSEYAAAAATRLKSEYDFAKSKWNDWLRTAGEITD